MNKSIIKKQLLQELERLKDRRGFIKAGLPRFDRLFGRDSLIVSWQLLDINPEICRDTLAILSKLQGRRINKLHEEEPGKIIHETDSRPHPGGRGIHFPYYGSVDATPLFLILFSFYFKKTKDKKFLKKHWQNILTAVDWMIHYGDGDQDLFLEYKRKSPAGLFHQGWKDAFSNTLRIKPPVAIVEAQGYQYFALKEISRLAKIMKDANLARRLLKKAKELKENFNEKFWMKEEKYFALALDGNKKPRKAITSNPGHLLFTGIVENRKVKPLVRRLFRTDLWTPFGIRTHSTEEPDFNPGSYHLGSVWPHDNWIIAQGLKKLGYKRAYQKIKKALLRAYQEIGFIPELYGVIDNKIILDIGVKSVCYPQAWATGTLLNLLVSR